MAGTTMIGVVIVGAFVIAFFVGLALVWLGFDE
jgi:hypothetical protein